jgi:ABC-type bacteriocin/lantibiotic exporter with double-glycine peptidase domain
MGYETRLATAGSNISGGQRQLLTLTAVLASDRPLLLLDEPMANLDRQTADRIWRYARLQRKTIIYAEHLTAGEQENAA